MTTKSNLTDITNTSTFGDWKDRTNEIIDVSKKSVTLGDSEVNTGNVNLSGNLGITATNTLTTDKVTTNSSSTVLSLEVASRVKGVLYVNQQVGTGATESVIQLESGSGNTPSWAIKSNSATSGDHQNLRIEKGNVILQVNGSTGLISSVGSTDIGIDSGLLSGGINNVSLGATTPSTGNFTKLDVTGSGGKGTVENVDIGAGTSGTGKFTTLIADGGGASVINNTPIGTTTASSGKFTSLIATGGGSSAINNVPIGASTANTGAFTTLTSSGAATFASATVTGTLSAVASAADGLTNTAITAVLNAVYPAGSIYLTSSGLTPSQLGLPGNWSRYAQGQALTGYKANDDSFTAGKESGNANKTLNVSEIPAHSHSIGPNGLVGMFNSPTRNSNSGPDVGSKKGSYNTNDTGGGNSFSIMQPYKVVYVWKRDS